VAGLGMAHDEIIPFSLRNGMIRVGEESTSFEGTLKIEFVKVCSTLNQQWVSGAKITGGSGAVVCGVFTVAVDITKMISDPGGVSHGWFTALY